MHSLIIYNNNKKKWQKNNNNKKRKQQQQLLKLIIIIIMKLIIWYYNSSTIRVIRFSYVRNASDVWQFDSLQPEMQEQVTQEHFRYVWRAW